MDLALLIAAENGSDAWQCTSSNDSNGTEAAGCPGISLSKAERLKSALEKASYVDFHERLWPISFLLPKLTLNRPANLLRNPNPKTSYILLSWMEHEFQSFCQNRSIGFCGAEAGILEYLCQSKTFQQASQSVWPRSAQCSFHQPRDDGANLDNNLDLIKADLMAFVRHNDIDTLFISLGGGAKILCHEISEELGIRCIDFGAMLRALCYLGSDGHLSSRSTHSPFFYRLPFSIVMESMMHSMPNLSSEAILAKAHAQLILELQRKEVGWTSSSAELELTTENRQVFSNSHAYYKQRFKEIFKTSRATRLERKHFLHFCGSNGLTSEGKLFFSLFYLKSKIARWLRM